MRKPTYIPYAGVICRLHGHIDIDKDDYIKQMNDVNTLWKCPICKAPAEFDDNRYEVLHPESVDEEQPD